MYESLVSSTLLYLAPVWGLRLFKWLERAQCGFFKRLFWLPRDTPGYLVRLELNIPHIAVKILNLTISCIIKILGIVSTRYPQICFFRLVQLSKVPSATPKLNWTVRLKDLLVLASEPLDILDSTSPEVWINRRDDILRNLRFALKYMDLQSYQASSNYQIPIIRTGEDTVADYTVRGPSFVMNLKIQLRLACRRPWGIIINRTKYIIDSNKVCPACSSDLESVEHILLYCPSYACYRARYLNSLSRGPQPNP